MLDGAERCQESYRRHYRFSKPSSILAFNELGVAIGPSIGVCCFEVDEPVMQPLRATVPFWEDVVEKAGTADKAMLNLKKLIALAALSMWGSGDGNQSARFLYQVPTGFVLLLSARGAGEWYYDEWNHVEELKSNKLDSIKILEQCFKSEPRN